MKSVGLQQFLLDLYQLHPGIYALTTVLTMLLAGGILTLIIQGVSYLFTHKPPSTDFSPRNSSLEAQD